MKETYTLYLDETSPNTSFPAFTLSGVIIKDTDYSDVKNKVEELKNRHFGSTTPILHEIDIRKQVKEFSTLTTLQVERFLLDFRDVFDEKLTVIGVTIKMNEISSLYDESDRNDMYLIALQVILENYCHFLIQHQSIGKIIVESTDDKHDQRLRVLFYRLLYTGTLFYTNKILQDHLQGIDFKKKKDNIIGLQIADFVPNPLARNALGLSQKSWSLFSAIEIRIYNNSNRFGHKIIP